VGLVAASRNVYGWDAANDDGDPMDDHRHGTHVAGTIDAAGNNDIGVAGVNWNVSLMAVKFLGTRGGTTANAIKAVQYVTTMRKAGVNVVASNNSWGGGAFNQSLKDAIDEGGKAGILFVAAAGNDANDNDESAVYPRWPPAACSTSTTHFVRWARWLTSSM
jgi:serine protease